MLQVQQEEKKHDTANRQEGELAQYDSGRSQTIGKVNQEEDKTAVSATITKAAETRQGVRVQWGNGV